MRRRRRFPAETHGPRAGRWPALAGQCAVLCLCVGHFSCGGAAGPDAAPRRVIWITVDSLRADHVGAYGYERDTTPWLDALAAESVQFEWALAPANHTMRSVAAYFAGRPYTMLHENAAEQGIPEEALTLAETLRSAGFRTRAYTSNAVLGTGDGFNQGFDEFQYVFTPGRLNASIDEITEVMKADYRRSDGHEFIYVHTMDVHFPYRPPAPYGRMFTRPYAGKSIVEGMPVYDAERTPAFSSHPFWDPSATVDAESTEFLGGLYDACIRYTDSRLSSLLEAIDWDPKFDLLIVTSDHGEQFYEMGWWSHFETLTPMEIRVPLLIHHPALPPRTIGECVSLMDLYPTILDLFGITHPHGLVGRSLAAPLRGGAMTEREVYSENSPKAGLSVALVSGQYWYWLRLNRTQHEPWHTWPYEEYLFRYRNDPLCKENLVKTESAVADQLNAHLRESFPRWGPYARERILGSDEDVGLGENLIAAGLIEITPAANGRGAVSAQAGLWTVDVPLDGLYGRVEGVEKGARYLLTLPYSLESGRIRVLATSAEYKRPGLGRVEPDWRHELVQPAAGQELRAVIVPLGESLDLRVVFNPGTRAKLGRPQLRKLLADWVEPWPQPASGWSGGDGDEHIERLKALAYL